MTSSSRTRQHYKPPRPPIDPDRIVGLICAAIGCALIAALAVGAPLITLARLLGQLINH